MIESDEIQRALAHDHTIDITTVGRRSGEPRRLEIWFHHIDGRVYISGLPGRRNWYANLLANPDFVFHLKESVQADLAARAHPVTDPAERRRVLVKLLEGIGRESALEDWMNAARSSKPNS